MSAPQFAFDHKLVKITSVNPRKEHHGDQLVQAVDLRISSDFENSALAKALQAGEAPTTVQ